LRGGFPGRDTLGREPGRAKEWERNSQIAAPSNGEWLQETRPQSKWCSDLKRSCDNWIFKLSAGEQLGGPDDECQKKLNGVESAECCDRWKEKEVRIPVLK
jgi:hypothetical protein